MWKMRHSLQIFGNVNLSFYIRTSHIIIDTHARSTNNHHYVFICKQWPLFFLLRCFLQSICHCEKLSLLLLVDDVNRQNIDHVQESTHTHILYIFIFINQFIIWKRMWQLKIYLLTIHHYTNSTVETLQNLKKQSHFFRNF